MIYLKYIILIIAVYGAVIGIFNLEIAPAIVAAGAFISYAMIETRDLKTLNDDKD